MENTTFNSEDLQFNPTSDGEAAAQPTELEIAQKAALDEKNKYLYLYADFENHKKRAMKERSELLKYGGESLARELLGAIDNLERATAHAPDNLDANYKLGIEMVRNQLTSTLNRFGIKEIEAQGKNFDPTFHEGMGQEPSSLPQGTITQVLTKGYQFHDRLLRPAQVIVSNGQATNLTN